MKRFRIPLQESLKNFMPLKAYFVKNKWVLIIGLLSLLCVDFLQLLIPLVIKSAINALTYKTATSGVLLKSGLIIVAIALLMGILRYIWRLLLFGHSRMMEEQLRNRLYSHLQALSLSFYHRTRTGDLMARAINDLNAIRMATGMGLVAFTDGMVLGLASIGFMIYISPTLTLICLIPAPIIIYMSRVFTRRMSTGYEKIQNTFSDLTERVREAFAGIRVVKAYSMESWEYEKVKKDGKRYISENMELAKTIGLFFPLMAIFTNLGLAVVIWLGGRLTILGTITTGDFVAFIAYLNLLTWPMMALGWVTNLIQRGSASMRRINRVLDEVPEIADPVQPKEITRIRGNIRFSGLTLTYPAKQSAALRNIHLSIAAGQTVALVGRVGTGKTSLLHTIPHLLRVPKGTVFLDDVDIHDIPLKILRENIGFITQEAFIFSDTIRNNVVFGRDDISEALLAGVLKAAQVYDEIQAFEKGLDTLLGERGITLSGGQRQRLTIARALISDPPILILDDALSMVDTRTEERILNQILAFREDKTNIIVSHRVSTIKRADHILVLEDGELVEQGDHNTLIKGGGEYAKIYERQLIEQELEIGPA